MRDYGYRTPLEEQEIGVGEHDLGLGSVARRADHRNPRDGRGADVHRGAEAEGSARGEEPWFTAPDPDRDRRGRSGRTAACGATRGGGGDLGGGISVAWCPRLAYRCDPLF